MLIIRNVVDALINRGKFLWTRSAADAQLCIEEMRLRDTGLHIL